MHFPGGLQRGSKTTTVGMADFTLTDCCVFWSQQLRRTRCHCCCSCCSCCSCCFCCCCGFYILSIVLYFIWFDKAPSHLDKLLQLSALPGSCCCLLLLFNVYSSPNKTRYVGGFQCGESPSLS